MKLEFAKKFKGWNIFENKISALGLDISGAAIKIFELQAGGNGAQTAAFCDTSLPKGVVSGDAIMDSETLSHLIRQSLEKPQGGRFTTKYAVASLPESKSFVRVIHMPRLAEAEAENAVLFEAEAYIPLPLDQVYLDWQPLRDKDGGMEVLIIAASRETVDKYLECLEASGLRLAALEVESQSLARALSLGPQSGPALIADLDAFRTNLVLVEDGSLQFTSSIPIAGSSFTEVVAKALGLTPAKAESVKKQVGINSTPEFPNLKTAALPLIANLAAEIQKILDFHSEHSSARVKEILLCGGSAKLKGLSQALSPHFSGIQIKLGEPVKNLAGLLSAQLSDYEALSFTTAIGLARRPL